MRLRVGGVEVARYVVEPELDVRLAPRPYLHPVRTLGGTPVTDALCFDHPWHLGASLTLADVAGANLWGGGTYVRGQGYTWLDDHGRVTHDGWLPADEGFAERLVWTGPAGETLLTEHRRVRAVPAEHGWRLTVGYQLTAPPDRAVPIGSPATHGRPGGAGYGGFFWRGAPGDATAFTAALDGADAVNGSAEPWVAVTVRGAYTLVFRGLSGADRWFVRTGDYVGVCAALAFERELVLPPGGVLARRISVLVADGSLSRDQIRGTGAE